jgi:hypothetical protein
VNSEDRRGVLARAWARIQSLWAERKTDAGQCYLIVLGVTVLLAVAVAPDNGLILPLFIFGIGWFIASLLKDSILAGEKLVAARNMLLRMAFQECCCKANSIIIEAPEAPELVGKPVGKGYCHVCKSRDFLEERFPGAIEELIAGAPERLRVRGIVYTRRFSRVLLHARGVGIHTGAAIGSCRSRKVRASHIHRAQTQEVSRASAKPQ